MFVTSWIDARKQKPKEQERVILFDNNSHYPESSIGIGYCTGMRWWWENFGNFYPKTLGCMERDIRKADVFGSGWGDVAIDKPKWMEFLKEIQKEMDLRGIARWQ